MDAVFVLLNFRNEIVWQRTLAKGLMTRGTTIAAAQKMNLRWIGIDSTNLAISLIRHRLRDTYGDHIEKTYQVVGEPMSVTDAEGLAATDEDQFQWWALGLVGARPAKKKKGRTKALTAGSIFTTTIPGRRSRSSSR
jgi:hypothetical protein